MITIPFAVVVPRQHAVAWNSVIGWCDSFGVSMITILYALVVPRQHAIAWNSVIDYWQSVKRPVEPCDSARVSGQLMYRAHEIEACWNAFLSNCRAVSITSGNKHWLM